MSRFDYVRYDEKAVEKQNAFKAAFATLDHLVETTLDNGRAKSLVYTKLEEAYMWVGKAIRDEQVAQRSAELEETRGVRPFTAAEVNAAVAAVEAEAPKPAAKKTKKK